MLNASDVPVSYWSTRAEYLLRSCHTLRACAPPHFFHETPTRQEQHHVIGHSREPWKIRDGGKELIHNFAANVCTAIRDTTARNANRHNHLQTCGSRPCISPGTTHRSPPSSDTYALFCLFFCCKTKPQAPRAKCSRACLGTQRHRMCVPKRAQLIREHAYRPCPPTVLPWSSPSARELPPAQTSSPTAPQAGTSPEVK